MRNDHSAYQLATRVSLGGFGLQLVMGVALLAAGLHFKDYTTVSAAYYALTGLLVWITLTLLFTQHRLERLEALEAQRLSEGGASATAIFETNDADLMVAAARLKWMHRWLLPASSLILAVGLMALGWWQQRLLGSQLDADAQAAGQTARQFLVASPDASAWMLAVSASIAAVAFIFSRYTAGMSKNPAWQNIRGGASAMVGVAVACTLLAVGFGFQINGNETAMRIVGRIIPWMIFLVGVEISVNFIMNLYRPRRPGEFPRAAFDSRILSLLAAPDTVARSISEAINYQFGFEVSSTWAYQLMSRQLAPLLALSLGLLIVLRCTGVVRPNEEAILTSFGRLASEEVIGPGLVLKWPWQSLQTYDVTTIRRLTLGNEPKEGDEPILWSSAHTEGDETLLIVRAGRDESVIEQGDNRLINDFAVLVTEVQVQYRIKAGTDAQGRPELLNYVTFVGGRDADREALLTAIATRRVMQHLSTLTIDEVLGSGRATLAHDLTRLIQSDFDEQSAGVQVAFVGVAGIHPPVEIAASYEGVLQAHEQARAAVQTALASATQRLAGVAGSLDAGWRMAEEIEALERLSPDTDPEGFEAQWQRVHDLLVSARGGTAATRLLEAGATRWQRHLSQWSAAVRHSSRVRLYEASPNLFKQREYLARLVDALTGSRLVINLSDADLRTTINLEEDPTTLSIGTSISEYDAQLGE